MAISPHTIETGERLITIYGETDNINYFLVSDLTPDTAESVETYTTSVASHLRRKYPGHNSPANITGGSRQFIADLSQKSGNALPGRSFTLAAVLMGPPNFNVYNSISEKRQFTFKGRLLDLHSFLKESVFYRTYLYTSRGARYTFDGLGEP